MPLPREAWQEDSLEPGTQDLPSGSDPQVSHSSMKEDTASAQVIEAISDTPSPSAVDVAHRLGWSHQVRHSNSAQNPTGVNLDASTLASPSVEEHNVPSQSSRLIPEYANLWTSGLRLSKIIQYKYRR